MRKHIQYYRRYNKPVIKVFLILFLFSSILIHLSSCGPSGSDKQFDSAFERADKLLKNKQLQPALQLFDSLNNVAGTKSGHFKYRAYSFWKEYYYSREMHDSNALYNDSIIWVIEKYKLADKLPAEYANALNNKGNNFFEKNDLAAAFDYYHQSRTIAVKLNDTCLISDQTYHMGMVTYRQEKFGEAAKYFKQSLAECAACKDMRMNFYRQEELINNIALSFSKLHTSDSSRLYYKKGAAYVADVARKNADDTDIQKFAKMATGVIYGNIATDYMESKQYDSAVPLLLQAIEINSRRNYDTQDVVYDWLKLAQIYVIKDRMPEAAALLKQADAQIANIPGRMVHLERLHITYEYYKKANNVPLALSYLEQYTRMEDSTDEIIKKLNKTDFPQLLKDQETEYQLNLLKKDSELSDLYLWIVLGVILVAIIIVGLVVVNYRRSIKSVKLLTTLNEKINAQKLQQDKTMEDLLKSNRDMDRILHVVAHDLRSPVSAIMMMCNLMADEIEDPSQKEILDMIVTSSKGQLALIGELLDFSKQGDLSQDKLVKENVDLNDLCKQVVAMLYFKADEKQQYINLTVAAEPVIVSCSSEKINRVINNLITNAIKFSPEGGAIQVTVIKQPTVALIQVKDNGIGIPEKNRAVLFDSFTTAKRYGTSGEKSFGLGLSICKQITEAHGGRIWFESEEGKGSSFFVELPLA